MRASLLLILLSGPVLAASVSGRVTSAGTGVADMEVRLWARTAKGYSFQPPNGRVVTTDTNGDFTMTGLAAGTYKVDTRMSMAVSGNFGDRWYDVAAPTSGGYLAEDADELVLAGSDARTGVDIAVEINGGLEARTVSSPTVPIGGLFVRLESVSDFRVHHNDVSKTTPATRLGETSFRGMPPTQARLIVHDPNYAHADVIGAPFAITASANGMGGDLVIGPAPADPNEPNDGFDAGTNVDVSPIRMTPPQVLVGSGSIGPRNSGDVDFYCWDAVAGDRYFVSAVGTLGTLPDGGVRVSPWVDPVVSFWRGGAKVAEDDDSGPRSFEARLDTGVVAAAGRVCAAVSTFGDTTWSGATQGSAGPYAVRLEMGNRPPVLTATVLGSPTPAPPATLTVNEGGLLTVAVTFSDPESNPLMASWDFRDSQNQSVSAGSFNGASGAGMVPFSPSQIAARRGPYTLTLTVADAEFTITKTVIVDVRGVNVPPAVPVQVSPDAGAIVMTSRPNLVCREASDDDGDALRYEFQVSWVDGGTVLTSGAVQIDAGVVPAGGLVAFTTVSLPENARLQWKVRAFDGDQVSGYSPWSADLPFVVDVTNEPPSAPFLVKPVDGDTLLVRRPTLEVVRPSDPEGDAISYVFEISRSANFSQVVVLSMPVPETVGATNTMWTVTQDLDWGTQYFARATAVDARGARSAPGNANAFTIRGNMAPMVPTPGMPFAMGLCADQVFTTAPTSLVIPPILDVEQDTVIVEVQVAKGDDRMFAMPLFKADVMANSATETNVSLASVAFEEDQKYRVRMRSKDGQNVTEWVECSFTLDARTGAGGGGPSMIVTKPGCGCASADASLLVGLLVLLARRRRA